MVVFASDYVESLRARWGARAEREWPLVAVIALKDRTSAIRDRVERYVARLHPDDQGKMTQQLRSQYATTYAELVVGQVLIDAGFAPRYEARVTTVDGFRTPDWFVAQPRLACDVFTAGLTRVREEDETSLREICARLRDLRAPYTLGLEVEHAGQLDAGERKQLAAAVERWLASAPGQGASTRIGAATLEVMAVGGAHVTVIPMEPLHTFEAPPSLAENFREKAKKYAPLGMPLIITAAQHPGAEIDAVDVEDVLLGTCVVGGRLPDGVFAARPSLSAGVWVNPHSYPAPEVRVWSNPHATAPLSANVLIRLAAAVP